MKLAKLIAIVILITVTNTFADSVMDIVEESVIYTYDGTTYEGYLAYDRNITGKRTGVVVFHQWMGLTDYEKRRCHQLAELGYLAFAADMYGQGIRPKDRTEASAQAGKFYADRSMFRNRSNAAVAQLAKMELADPAKTVAIGYCYGGTAVLELARSGADIKGIVSFHGGLENPNPEDARNIKCSVAVMHGGADPYVTQEHVQAFKDEMNAAGVDYYLTSFAGAVHGFTQPGKAYNAKADSRSWEMMRNFIEEVSR
jgi:dienelactone hydrolase